MWARDGISSTSLKGILPVKKHAFEAVESTDPMPVRLTDIARSHRGTQGGITLARRPSDIALLEIVEACQGKVLANYCDDAPNIDDVCSFHRAMIELHDATLKVLSRWTLADLAERPHPTGTLLGIDACRMKGVPAPDGDVAS